MLNAKLLGEGTIEFRIYRKASKIIRYVLKNNMKSENEIMRDIPVLFEKKDECCGCVACYSI